MNEVPEENNEKLKIFKSMNEAITKLVNDIQKDTMNSIDEFMLLKIAFKNESKETILIGWDINRNNIVKLFENLGFREISKFRDPHSPDNSGISFTLPIDCFVEFDQNGVTKRSQKGRYSKDKLIELFIEILKD